MNHSRAVLMLSDCAATASLATPVPAPVPAWLVFPKHMLSSCAVFPSTRPMESDELSSIGPVAATCRAIATGSRCTNCSSWRRHFFYWDKPRRVHWIPVQAASIGPRAHGQVHQTGVGQPICLSRSSNHCNRHQCCQTSVQHCGRYGSISIHIIASKPSLLFTPDIPGERCVHHSRTQSGK